MAYFTTSHTALLLKSYLGLLAFYFFLIFVGGLCNAVWGAHERLQTLRLAAFGGGLTATALQMASSAVSRCVFSGSSAFPYTVRTDDTLKIHF